MEIWFLNLMNDSVSFLKRYGKDKCVDLIESTPFGLLDTVFGGCETIADVEAKCNYVYATLELSREVILDGKDDDPDWE